MSDSPPTAAHRLQEFLRGYYVSQALYVAAKLGLPDLLHATGGRASVDYLAQKTATHPAALYRLLRALASEGIFQEHADRSFALNDTAALLRHDAPGTLRPAALLAGETQYKVWTQLKDTLKPNAPSGFERIFRVPLFDFLAQHPDAYALFNAAMEVRVASARTALLEACQIHPHDMIVDIGGGTAAVLRALLEKHPHSRGTLLETAPVIEQTRQTLANTPFQDRITLVTGDCLQAIPPGDVMLLVTVLHMFQDEPASRILHNCRAALPAGGRLYIAEALLRGPNEKDPAKWQDVNMLLMTGGRERTYDEYATLLKQAGFATVLRKGEILEARP